MTNLTESGARLQRILQHIQNGDRFVTMSAAKGHYSGNQNRNRMQGLAADLRAAGFGIISLSGVWAGESEPSLIAFVRPDRALALAPADEALVELTSLAVRLGAKYQQDATIIGDGNTIYLLDTQGEVIGVMDAISMNQKDFERIGGYSARKGKGFVMVAQNDPELAAEQPVAAGRHNTA